MRLTQKDAGVARSGAEMGAFSPVTAFGGWSMLHTHFETAPAWVETVSVVAGVLVLLLAALMALGGWVAIWEAIGELNAQAEERRRETTEDPK